jgi:hypothetical protein
MVAELQHQVIPDKRDRYDLKQRASIVLKVEESIFDLVSN